LNITKGLLDHCEGECERLRASNAELLAALEELEAWGIFSNEEWSPSLKARAAIARAKGGRP